MNQTYHVYRKPTCPFGEKVVRILNREGIEFSDHVFGSKEEEEAFKKKYSVKNTPQIFIDGERFGGYSDLARKFGELQTQDNQKTYRPIIAIFTTAALLAIATSTGILGFMGFSLSVLALLKLMDIASFVEDFKQYDLLSKAIPLYAKVYPFLELIAGLGFVSGAAPMMTGIIATLVGIIGGFSTFKAVYVAGSDLNCACVGGNQNVPLGPISLTENAMMATMGIYILLT
jgi:glutaredoxin